MASNFQTTFLLLLLTIIPNTQIFTHSLPLPLPLSTTRAVTEKLTHLHFFFQDIVSGPNPTAVPIAGPKTGPGFGTMMMADDTLTSGQARDSEVIGRAQGVYAVASQQQQEFAFLMVMNYVFTKGEYNGSSIAILGRNPPMKDVREMPIVGGTGLFRLARGYALAHTVWANPQGDATVEYNVYVSHMDQVK